MSESSPEKSHDQGVTGNWLGGLPRRDLVVLPLICVVMLAGLIGLVAAGERISRHYYTETLLPAPCLHQNTDLGISHGIPNCSGVAQGRGTLPVKYVFDRCGYRNPPGTVCGPKPHSTRRIVLVGASVALGYPVEEQYSVANRLAQDLTQACRMPVEVQDLGAIGNEFPGVERQVPEVLGLQPDLVVLFQISNEINRPEFHQQVLRRHDSPPAAVEPQVAESYPHKMLRYLGKLRDMGPGAIGATMRLQTAFHEYAYSDSDYFVKMYMLNADTSDYLRPLLAPQWRQRMQDAELVLGEIAGQLRAAGVPFALLTAPTRAQAVVLRNPGEYPDLDPYMIIRQWRGIAARQGIEMLDTLPAFAAQPHPERLFFKLDGHPNNEGYRLIADTAVRTLTSPGAPFADCGSTTATVAGQ